MRTLSDALTERDQILTAMDVDAAKAFIANHGGFVPSGVINWVKVLHLARYEVRSLPDELVRESHIWLAVHGAQSVMTLSPTSPYCRAAMDLIFPKDLTDALVFRNAEGAAP